MVNLLAGEVQTMFDLLSTSIESIRVISYAFCGHDDETIGGVPTIPTVSATFLAAEAAHGDGYWRPPIRRQMSAILKCGNTRWGRGSNITAHAAC